MGEPVSLTFILTTIGIVLVVIAIGVVLVKSKNIEKNKECADDAI
jgi:hypothetical protein